MSSNKLRVPTLFSFYIFFSATRCCVVITLIILHHWARTRTPDTSHTRTWHTLRTHTQRTRHVVATAETHISEYPGGYSVNHGTRLSLQCVAHGDPLPAITWTSDNNTVHPCVDRCCCVQHGTPYRMCWQVLLCTARYTLLHVLTGVTMFSTVHSTACVDKCHWVQQCTRQLWTNVLLPLIRIAHWSIVHRRSVCSISITEYLQ